MRNDAVGMCKLPLLGVLLKEQRSNDAVVAEPDIGKPPFPPVSTSMT